MASVNTLIARMRYWCEVANMGYSQSDRWNFNPKAGNCDCSSLVIHCLREAGFDTGTAVNTANLSVNLTSRGWKRLPVDGHPKAGDILLNDVNHVAVYLGGGQLAQASISEHNSLYGTAGDQTGRETNISPYYNFPWNCYLRYESEDDMPTAQEIAAAVWEYKYKDSPAGGNMFNLLSYELPHLIWEYNYKKSAAGGNMYNALNGTAGNVNALKTQLAALQTQVAALTETVKTLATADGADPDAIAKTVETAVRDKLDRLRIAVTDVG